MQKGCKTELNSNRYTHDIIMNGCNIRRNYYDDR